MADAVARLDDLSKVGLPGAGHRGSVAVASGDFTFQWRGTVGNRDLNRLHADGFGHDLDDRDWVAQLSRHSLGWVVARHGRELAGFVNVAWDGGIHAFLLDTLVAASFRRQGVASRLIGIAADQARAAGCTWLHVDFEEHLSAFYLDACQFSATAAGLLRL